MVKEGQLGSLTVFGRAVRRNGKIKVIKPGLRLMIPLVHNMQKAHIRMDSLELNDLNVTLKNGLSYHYSAYVAYHVSGEPDDLEKFLYKVENPQELISQKLSSEIRELLTKEEDAQNATGKEINEKLSKILQEYLIDKIGVTLDSCGLTSLTESATAQQVSVTVAKVAYAKTLYKKDGEENAEIPETVLAACFGSSPITAPLTVSQKEHQKKEEKSWFSVKRGASDDEEG